MNLHQFRVLAAVFSGPAEFTTADLMRATGVSPEVVRKTYQRYDQFFRVVREEKSGPSGGIRKVRTLTPAGRENLARDLSDGRSLLPPPPFPQGPEGEPLGLVAAERTFYESVPAADREERTLLLAETRSHVELATRACALAAENETLSVRRPPSAALEVRLNALRRMLNCAEVLHTANTVLRDKEDPKHESYEIDLLTEAFLNAQMASEYHARVDTRETNRLVNLLALRSQAPQEVERVIRALRMMGSEPAWCKALGVPGRLWTDQDDRFVASFNEPALQLPRVSEAFSIVIDPWTEVEDDNATGSFLRISADGKVATRHADSLSTLIKDSVRLPVYQLATWFITHWWRLRWEPAPWGTPPLSWSAAHDLSQIGDGFVWPPLRFSSNGKQIYVQCKPRVRPEDSVQYLEDFECSVPTEEFEHAIDTFIEKVQDQLVELDEKKLHTTSRELALERKDPVCSDHRRLEAMLGFNRNEAPDHAMRALKDLSTEGGTSAIYELAPAYSGHDVIKMVSTTWEIVHSSKGEYGQVENLPSILESVSPLTKGELPWERGLRLARVCRDSFGLGSATITDAKLAETIGLTETQFQDSPAVAHELPFGLAIRPSGTKTIRFLFQKRLPESRRFEAARFLADALIAGTADSWLLQTHARTARQQTQRAFAVELLVPIANLMEFLKGDFSPDAIENAADFFGVSSVAVQHHVDNNAPVLAAAAAA
jgi:hypothetical protein